MCTISSCAENGQEIQHDCTTDRRPAGGVPLVPQPLSDAYDSDWRRVLAPATQQPAKDLDAYLQRQRRKRRERTRGRGEPPPTDWRPARTSRGALTVLVAGDGPVRRRPGGSYTDLRTGPPTGLSPSRGCWPSAVARSAPPRQYLAAIREGWTTAVAGSLWSSRAAARLAPGAVGSSAGHAVQLESA